MKKNKFIVFLGICAFLIGNRLSLYYQFLCSQGKEFPIFETLNGVIESYSFSILGISIGIDVFSILWGLLGICIVILTVLYYKSSRRNYREGEEHGSARYGDIKNEGEPLKDINENNNIILSQNIQLSMDTRLTFLNNNVCIVGGSGSGKTFYFNEPNVLNMSCNYIITDPKL